MCIELCLESIRWLLLLANQLNLFTLYSVSSSFFESIFQSFDWVKQHHLPPPCPISWAALLIKQLRFSEVSVLGPQVFLHRQSVFAGLRGCRGWELWHHWYWVVSLAARWRQKAIFPASICEQFLYLNEAYQIAKDLDGSSCSFWYWFEMLQDTVASQVAAWEVEQVLWSFIAII